jgi:hypothetical protein
MLKQAFFRALRPLALAVLEHLPRGDPWDPFPYHVPHELFSSGSKHDFRWYFQGQSRVQVSSFDEICEWLLACEYRSDLELFMQPDFWQHPLTFEQIRKGDCDDHALWAWRKLVELGFSAELLVGRWLQKDGSWGEHAWVAVTRGSDTVHLQAATKDRASMVLDSTTAHRVLRPHFGVNAGLARRVFDGWLHSVLDDRAAARSHPATVA